MSLSKKHFKKLAELICNNYDAKTNKINMGFTSELSNYLKEQNNRFDSLTFFNAIKEGTKSAVEKQKEFLKNKKDLLKENKILQSKVKTYEADIEADIKDGLHNYSYNNNCYCVKCKQYRLNNVKNSEQDQKEVLRDLGYIKSL